MKVRSSFSCWDCRSRDEVDRFAVVGGVVSGRYWVRHGLKSLFGGSLYIVGRKQCNQQFHG